MSFSYSGEPGSSFLDYVRFEVQDTDPEAPLLQDGEILFCIEQEAPGEHPSEGELLGAAARALEALSRRWAKQANSQIGSLKLQWDKAAEVLSERARELRVRAAGMNAPFVGGLSESAKQTLAEDPDLVQPAFTREQFTNPWRGVPGGPGPVTLGEGGPL